MSEDATKEFEEMREAARVAQNLPEGAVPEQRPIASQTVDDPHSRIFKELRDAGDDRAGAPAMDKEAYDRAASPEQARKAAKMSQGEERLYPGARGWVNNEGTPDHGRAVAINRVTEWASPDDELLAAAGTPNSRFARPAEYECVTRDGRAELLLIKAENFRRAVNEADWGKTSIS